jgi:hypothetical protein
MRTCFRLLCVVVFGLWAITGMGADPPGKGTDAELEFRPLPIPRDKFPEKPAEYTSMDAGCTWEWGAIDLGKKPEGMIMVQGSFPEPLRFVRIDLVPYGDFTDPGTKLKGKLFSAMVLGKKRWFFIGDDGGSRRNLFVYDVDGNVIARNVVNYAKQ